MALNFLMKFTPTMEANDVRKMERDLNTRFGNVAKGFGKGLQNAAKLMGTGLKLAIGGAGIMGLLNVLLNPVSKVLENMDKTLRLADIATTSAAEYGITPREYQRMANTLQARGVTQQDFETDMAAMRALQGQARTGESSVLAEFKDIESPAQLFSNIMGSIMDLDANDRFVALERIIGRRRAIKYIDFLQQGREGIAGEASYLDPSGRFNELSKTVGVQEDMLQREITKMDQDFQERRMSHMTTDPKFMQARLEYERSKRELEQARFEEGKTSFDLAILGMRIEDLIIKTLSPILERLHQSGIIEKLIGMIEALFGIIENIVNFFKTWGASKEQKKNDRDNMRTVGEHTMTAGGGRNFLGVKL